MLISLKCIKATFPRRGDDEHGLLRDALVRADEQAVDVSQLMDDSYSPAPAGEEVIKCVQCLNCTKQPSAYYE